MSTRAAIARPNGEGFLGRYHHWDGYPEGLGATLYWLAQSNDIRSAVGLPPTPWDGDIEKMLKVLLDDHTGWSTINGKDFRKDPGFMELSLGDRDICVCGKLKAEHLCQNVKPHDDPVPCSPTGSYALHLGHAYEASPAALVTEAERAVVPECYCHGDRHQEGWDVDERNASGSGVEYAYVIQGRKMTVLSSYTKSGAKMIGAFGMGDPDSEWKPIGVVNLDGVEPNWKAMDKEEDEV